MNETNRTSIILLAALWIVFMAVLIFIAWAADVETVGRLDDFVQYLDDHRDNASRLILTLGALVIIVLALLLIIVELAPEEEAREIRVEQAGATTIVPVEPLRLRLEEALTAIPQVTNARARVFSRDRGVGMKLDLTVTPDANIAVVTQEASRVVVETFETDLGLPVSAPPTVRITFGPSKVEPVASSMTQPPAPESSPPPTAGPQTPPPSEPVAPPGELPPGGPTTYEATPDVAPQPAAEEPEPAQPPFEAPGQETPPDGESASEDQTQQY